MSRLVGSNPTPAAFPLFDGRASEGVLRPLTQWWSPEIPADMPAAAVSGLEHAADHAGDEPDEHGTRGVRVVLPPEREPSHGGSQKLHRWLEFVLGDR
jgi:hypothetical protein